MIKGCPPPDAVLVVGQSWCLLSNEKNCVTGLCHAGRSRKRWSSNRHDVRQPMSANPPVQYQWLSVDRQLGYLERGTPYLRAMPHDSEGTPYYRSLPQNAPLPNKVVPVPLCHCAANEILYVCSHKGQHRSGSVSALAIVFDHISRWRTQGAPPIIGPWGIAGCVYGVRSPLGPAQVCDVLPRWGECGGCRDGGWGSACE